MSPTPPAPGLQNALAATPHSDQISLLTAKGCCQIATLALPTLPTTPSPTPTAHASSATHFLFAVANTLHLSDKHTRTISTTPLHFSPTALSLATLPNNNTLLLLAAGFDGAYHVSVPLPVPSTLPSLQLLPGTQGHICVAAAVHPQPAVAVAGAHGDVAVWTKFPSRVPPLLISVPSKAQSTDRITQIQFLEEGDRICVAWWSSRFLQYALSATEATLVSSIVEGVPRGIAAFGTWPGAFFVCVRDEMAGRVVVLSRGDGLLLFVDHAGRVAKKNVRKKCEGDKSRVVVKGICEAPSGVFLWVYGAKELIRVSLDALIFEEVKKEGKEEKAGANQEEDEAVVTPTAEDPQEQMQSPLQEQTQSST